MKYENRTEKDKLLDYSFNQRCFLNSLKAKYKATLENKAKSTKYKDYWDTKEKLLGFLIRTLEDNPEGFHPQALYDIINDTKFKYQLKGMTFNYVAKEDGEQENGKHDKEI